LDTLSGQRISCHQHPLSRTFLSFAVAGERLPSRSAPNLMLMRNVFPMNHSNKIDSSPRPSPRSRRRGRRTCAPWFIVLLTLTLLFAGLAAPLTILGAPKIAFPANIDWPAYL